MQPKFLFGLPCRSQGELLCILLGAKGLVQARHAGSAVILILPSCSMDDLLSQVMREEAQWRQVFEALHGMLLNILTTAAGG